MVSSVICSSVPTVRSIDDGLRWPPGSSCAWHWLAVTVKQYVQYPMSGNDHLVPMLSCTKQYIQYPMTILYNICSTFMQCCTNVDHKLNTKYFTKCCTKYLSVYITIIYSIVNQYCTYSVEHIKAIYYATGFKNTTNCTPLIIFNKMLLQVVSKTFVKLYAIFHLNGSIKKIWFVSCYASFAVATTAMLTFTKVLPA